MLPAPPHCATSRPPGRRTRGEVREQRVVVGDPVERRRRQDRVDRRGSIGSGRPRSATDVRHPIPEPAPAARALPRPSTARRRARPRARRAGARASCSVTRPEPQPASSTVSSPRERQPVEDGRAPAGHRVGDAVVGRAVPVVRPCARPAAQPTAARLRRCGRLSALPRTGPRSSPRRDRSPMPFASAPAASSAAHTIDREVQRIDRRLRRRLRRPPAACLGRRVERLDLGPELRVVRVEARDGRARAPRRTTRRRRRRSRADEQRLPDPRDRVVDRRREARRCRPGRSAMSVRRQRRDDEREPDPEQQDARQDVDERRRPAADSVDGSPSASVPRRACRPGSARATAGRAAMISGPTTRNRRAPMAAGRASRSAPRAASA